MSETPEEAPLARTEPLVEMPARRKTIFFVTWLVGLLATANFSPFAALFLPLFPLVLASVLPEKLDDQEQIAAIGIGWCIYFIHAWLMLRTKSPRLYWLLFAVLVVLLVVNMRGCQDQLKNLAHIH